MDAISTLTSAISLVQDVINIAKEIADNNKSAKTLQSRLERMYIMLQETQESGTQPESVLKALDEIQQIIEGPEGLKSFLLQICKKKNIFTKLFKISHRNQISSQINSYNTSLDRILSDLTASSVLRVADMLQQSIKNGHTTSIENIYVTEPEDANIDDDIFLIKEDYKSRTIRMKSKIDNFYYSVKRIPVTNLQDEYSQYYVQNEIYILSHLTHANILRYYTSYYSQNNQIMNIVFELADKGNLYQQIRQYPPLLRVAKWLEDLFDALSYMHTNLHYLHRNIYGENILINYRNEVKLSGFEYACQFHPDSLCTERGIGLDIYSSFEKAQGYAYDGRDDVWAIGCVFAELLTHYSIAEWGGPLYDYENLEIKKRKSLLLHSLRYVNHRIVPIIETALTDSVIDRPQAEELLFNMNSKNQEGNLSPTTNDSPTQIQPSLKQHQQQQQQPQPIEQLIEQPNNFSPDKIISQIDLNDILAETNPYICKYPAVPVSLVSNASECNVSNLTSIESISPISSPETLKTNEIYTNNAQTSSRNFIKENKERIKSVSRNSTPQSLSPSKPPLPVHQSAGNFPKSAAATSPTSSNRLSESNRPRSISKDSSTNLIINSPQSQIRFVRSANSTPEKRFSLPIYQSREDPSLQKKTNLLPVCLICGKKSKDVVNHHCLKCAERYRTEKVFQSSSPLNTKFSDEKSN